MVTLFMINLIIGLITYPMVVKEGDRCGLVFIIYVGLILTFSIFGILIWKIGS
jgi:hypothetical protein